MTWIDGKTDFGVGHVGFHKRKGRVAYVNLCLDWGLDEVSPPSDHYTCVPSSSVKI